MVGGDGYAADAASATKRAKELLERRRAQPSPEAAMRVVAFTMDRRLQRTPPTASLGQAENALSLPGLPTLNITGFRHDGAVSRLCRDLGITKEERRAHAHRAQLPV